MTSDWNIAAGHIAERCQNFVIIAFGESIAVTGASIVLLILGGVMAWYRFADRAGTTTTPSRGRSGEAVVIDSTE